jgi:hypothetical protein
VIRTPASSGEPPLDASARPRGRDRTSTRTARQLVTPCPPREAMSAEAI